MANARPNRRRLSSFRWLSWVTSGAAIASCLTGIVVVLALLAVVSSWTGATVERIGAQAAALSVAEAQRRADYAEMMRRLSEMEARLIQAAKNAENESARTAARLSGEIGAHCEP